MQIQWMVTAMYAGNLQTVPLHGVIHDYHQKAPGLIEVSILCTSSTEVLNQVAAFINPNEPWCSHIALDPYFPQYPELWKEAHHVLSTTARA